MKPCAWKPCTENPDGISVYCAQHREQARRNVIRSLGWSAPSSLMWRDGDEEWLFSETIGELP